jgi:hypothetical protein
MFHFSFAIELNEESDKQNWRAVNDKWWIQLEVQL